MKNLFLTFAFIFVSTVYSSAQESSILVTPQWLHDHLHDPNLVIVHVNYIKLDYQNEHIEGARYLWPEWLAPNSPEGSMNAPDLKEANELIGSLGISNSSHIVLCHAGKDVSVTARMFLMFEYLGMKEKVSFLNGGLEAWKSAGYPVTQALPEFKKATFHANINPVLVDRQYVSNRLNAPDAVIVDARMTRFYDGEPTGNPRDGHIKGAKNIPYTDLYDQNTSLIKPVDQLQPYFDAITPKDKELVTYCFIGQTASVVYLSGRILGYDMKLYDGSMQEWSRIKELPMEITEKK